MKSKLEAKFPNYKFNVRAKNFLIAAKSNFIGANIVLRNNRLIIAGNFPTIGASLLFVLLIFISLLIFALIYLIAFHPKMKAVEKEIAEFLKTEYNLVS
jgi:hypothetical protein